MSWNGRLTWDEIAQFMWPEAEWIAGEGRYACVARCGGYVTVVLHPDIDAAEAALGDINGYGCPAGERCEGRHYIAFIRRPSKAARGLMRREARQ